MTATLPGGSSISTEKAKRRKTLLKHVFLIGATYFCFALTVFVVALCLGLGNYMRLLVKSVVLGERAVVVQKSLKVTVPRGWVVNNREHYDGFKNMVPFQDLIFLVQHYPRSLSRLREGGLGTIICFLHSISMERHDTLGSDYKSWRGRPEKWDDMTVGGVDARFVFTMNEYYSDGTDYRRGYIEIPEQEMAIFFSGDENTWELWKEILADAEWLEPPEHEASQTNEALGAGSRRDE